MTRLAPRRFLLFGGLFAVALPVGVVLGGWRIGLLSAFDLAAAVFLASLWPLMRDHGAAAMRRRSAQNDANRAALLALTATVSIAVLGVIAAALGEKAAPSPQMVALIVATLILSWLFSNAVFTLHYAHVFYRQGADGDRGGLGFPDCDEPDYWDFAYFAFTLGMTFQTSDVEIRTRSLRKVALFHSLAAFLFNIGVLAFSINVLGG